MNARWLLCTLAAGCFPITTEQPSTDSPPTDSSLPDSSLPATCDPLHPNSVLWVRPTVPQDDVPTTGGVAVDLAEEGDAVEIVVRDASGEIVPIRVFGNRQRDFAVFPLVSWDAQMTHELSVTHSCGTERFPFRTTPGVPAVSPETLLGTWEIDAHGYGMNESAILQGFATPETFPMAWEILAITGDSMDLRLAATSGEDVGAGKGQDRCVPTIDVFGVPFGRNPSFAFESPLPMRYRVDYRKRVPVVLQEGWMAATFGDRYGLRFGGIVDTTVLDPAYDGSDVGFVDLCDAVDVLGGACEACPDGGTTCLPTGGILNVQMIAVPELSLVARTAADIAADPACQ